MNAQRIGSAQTFQEDRKKKYGQKDLSSRKNERNFRS